MTGFLAARSLREALTLLDEHPGARPLAGGTDVLVHLRHAPPSAPPTLIGLDRVPELRGIREGDGWLAIGACTSFAQIAASPLVAAYAPVLQAAARTIGAPAIRTMATIGGNLCTASPAGDSLPALHVLQAQVELVCGLGCRRLAVSEFVTGPGETRLGSGEILGRVLVPLGPAADLHQFEKVGCRRSLAIAVASFAGLLHFDSGRRIVDARFAWGSVGPTVVRVPEAEALLRDQPADRVDPTVLDRTVDMVCAAVRPIDDLRASARYRRALSGSLLRRFLSPLSGPDRRSPTLQALHV